MLAGIASRIKALSSNKNLFSQEDVSIPFPTPVHAAFPPAKTSSLHHATLPSIALYALLRKKVSFPLKSAAPTLRESLLPV